MDDITVYGVPNQPRNYPAQVHRENPSVELGEMPFYGQSGHCIGAYYFGERN